MLSICKNTNPSTKTAWPWRIGISSQMTWNEISFIENELELHFSQEYVGVPSGWLIRSEDIAVQIILTYSK